MLARDKAHSLRQTESLGKRYPLQARFNPCYDERGVPSLFRELGQVTVLLGYETLGVLSSRDRAFPRSDMLGLNANTISTGRRSD